MDGDQTSYVHYAETHAAVSHKPFSIKDTTKAKSSVNTPTRPSADLVSLAKSSTSLSSRMYNLADVCGHTSTCTQAEEVAGELANVSTVLYRLNEAMTEQPDRYTQAFKEDLDRNNAELGLYLDEISECAEELHRKDPLGNEHVVPWFFKKGRVDRLIKHLQLLKGQLSIMRLVLNEGSEFLVTDEEQREPRPLTEARVTIEAALAKNQNAIREVLEYENAIRTDSTVSQLKTNMKSNRNKSGTLRGVNQAGCSADPFTNEHGPVESDIAHLNRRFTKRARDGMHIPIMSIGNNSARLKSKWIKQEATNSSMLTALPEASPSTATTSAPHGSDVIRPTAVHPLEQASVGVGENEKASRKNDPTTAKPETKWDRFKRSASKLSVLKDKALEEKHVMGSSEHRMSSYREGQSARSRSQIPTSISRAEQPAATSTEIWQEMKIVYAYPFKLIAAGFQRHKAGGKAGSRKQG